MVIYKTTNRINGKYYIGKDAKNYNGYLGSGIVIKAAIKKYGKENFIKEILCSCISLEELAQKEMEYITPNILKDPSSYNLALGGQGGDLSKFRKKSIKGKTWEERFGIERAKELKHQQSLNFSGKNNPMYGKIPNTEQAKKTLEERGGHPNKGKHLSKETKDLIRKKFEGKTWEELFGEENAKQRRANSKNKKRSYHIEMMDIEGNLIRPFNTMREAIDKLNLSSKKAYNNSYPNFKFRKIDGTI